MGIGQVTLRRAVFLDRDGVINRNVWNPDIRAYEAPRRADNFTLLPGVMPTLRKLQEAEFLLFLVSNQPDVAKGKATMEELAAVHERLLEALRTADVSFAAYYYCYHHPQWSAGEACLCRKPSPYFLLKARDDFRVELSHSWMIGDRDTDIRCGQAAGTSTIRLPEDIPSVCETKADFNACDLSEAVNIILRSDK